MNTHAFEKKLHSLKARFGLQLFVLAAVVCTSWIVTDHANAVYILTGPEDAAIVLNEEEVREGEMSSQLVYLSSGQSGYDMSLTAGQEVTVTHDGSTVTAKARSETVAELLERLRAGEGGRKLLRMLGQYGVSVYEKHFAALEAAGDLEVLENGAAILRNPDLYREDTGLSLEADSGKGLFI